MMTINFARPWHIRSPIIYRYIDEQYVDEFFDAGRLRLTCMSKFRTYADEQRGDPDEGKVLAQSTIKPGWTFTVMSGVGRDTYILCGSTILSDDIGKMFNAKSRFAIAIRNPVDFACCVAFHVPGYVEGMEGPCLYSDELLAVREVEGQSMADHTDENGHFIIGGSRQLQVASQMMSPDDYFRKRNIYKRQSEYRLLWKSSIENPGEYHSIVCPEARQFCERIEIPGN